MNIINKNYFKTSSFYLTCFLICKGLELIDLEKENPDRCKFVFLETPQREKLVEIFNFAKEDSPNILIDPRKMATTIKQLKSALYEDRF